MEHIHPSMWFSLTVQPSSQVKNQSGIFKTFDFFSDSQCLNETVVLIVTDIQITQWMFEEHVRNLFVELQHFCSAL